MIASRYLLLFLIPLLAGTAHGQWKEPPATGSPENTLADRTTLAGQSGLGPLLIAKLVDTDANSRKHRIVVQVETDGVRIVDAAAANHEPKLDEAHIEYRLDSDAPVESTSKTWTAQDIPSGEHRIRVALVSSDNHQMGKEKVLKVHVP
jgi:hypothetical protein